MKLLLQLFICFIFCLSESFAQSRLFENFEPAPGQGIGHFRYLRKNCWVIKGMSYQHRNGIDSACITTGVLKRRVERSITTGNVFIAKGNTIKFKYRLTRAIPIDGFVVLKVSAIALEGAVLYTDSIYLQKFNTEVNEHELMFPQIGFAKIKIAFKGEHSRTVMVDNIDFDGRYLQCQSCLPIAVPQVQDVSRCGTGPVFIPAPGGNLNEYRWFDANLNQIPNQNGAGLNTTITSDQTFYVSISRAGCQSPPAKVVARVIPQPEPPETVVNGNRCGQGEVVLQASGAQEGTYRWFETTSPTSIIIGATSGTFITPNLEQTTTYWVGVANGSCLSWRRPVTAVVTDFSPYYTVEPINATVNKYRAFPTGANYQWYSGNDSVPGAIWSQFNTDLPDIAVRVTINNCPCYYPQQPGARFAVAVEETRQTLHEINIYPNPANDFVHINGTFETPSSVEFTIIDALGRMQLKNSFHTDSQALDHKLNIKFLKPGFYTLLVQHQGSVKKFRLLKS